ncbi:MAG: hypothetical protein WCL08_06750, partial [Verrucomicrobiota bacterium]
VESLRRTRIGTLRIDKLRAGMWRMLSPKDINDLKAARAPKKRVPVSALRTNPQSQGPSQPPIQGVPEKRPQRRATHPKMA